MIRCVGYNIKKLASNYYFYVVIAYLSLKVAIAYSRYSNLAFEMKQKTSFFDLSLMFSARELILYVAIIALLFCNAPFYDASSQFSLIRVGRVKWILSQILSIFVVSGAVILVMCCAGIMAMLKTINFSNDWGILFKSMSLTNGGLYSFSLPVILNELSPLVTFFLSLFMAWLVSVFIGMMFMCLNFFFGKVASFSSFGLLLFMHLAAPMIGLLNWGYGVTYFTPFTYADVFYAREFAVSANRPGMGYCIFVLTLGILIFSVSTVIGFCRKDLDAGREE